MESEVVSKAITPEHINFEFAVVELELPDDECRLENTCWASSSKLKISWDSALTTAASAVLSALLSELIAVTSSSVTKFEHVVDVVVVVVDAAGIGVAGWWFWRPLLMLLQGVEVTVEDWRKLNCDVVEPAKNGLWAVNAEGKRKEEAQEDREAAEEELGFVLEGVEKLFVWAK